MSSHKCEIVKIESIRKHDNADRLEVISIYGYTVCVAKGEFKVGDTAIYIPPDSLVPTDKPEFSFLGDGGASKVKRIKVRKLRGVISQGLLIPNTTNGNVGDNVIEELGIIPYTPALRVRLGGDFCRPPDVFAPTYDLHNFARYNRLFSYGERVCVSEKIHGCLRNSVRVSMPDGTRVRIKELVDSHYRGEVLGYDTKNGKITSTKVTNTFKNGTVRRWRKINFTRKLAGRGSSYGSITCTPNHKIYDPYTGKYVQAKDLRVGQDVELVRSELSVTPLKEQILIGMMLGDASIRRLSESASIHWSHKKEHNGYMRFIELGLGDLFGNEDTEITSGYGTRMCRARTTSLGLIKNMFDGWLSKDGKKEIPKSIISKIGPIALAFWYMDDGSLAHNEGQEDRALFATNGFCEKSVENLIESLLKFGIVATKYFASGWRIRLSSDDSDKLFLLISPYVPKIMQYKIPERYRGHDGWMPQDQYKPSCVKQKITTIEDLDTPLCRYDIETEAHNFFGNGILVHNSNTRVTCVDGELFVGSRRHWLKDDGNVYWRAVKQYPEIELLCRSHPGLVVYGEIYGYVQSLRYGHQKGCVSFAAFDILHKDKWLSFYDARSFGRRLPWTPVVFEGNYGEEKIHEITEGDSLIPGAKHLREGVVIQPIFERTNDQIGRVKLKSVSDEYLMQK